MTLTVHTLALTPAQTRAALRVNAAMARAPRLKFGGWRMALGVRLNAVLSGAAGRITAATLKRRGVAVSSEHIARPAAPVPVRVLRPTGPVRALVVDLHGGGWVLGSAALNDRLTGHLAEAGFAVCSVDYRLLDERRGVGLPDAVDDCAWALRWALEEGAERFGVRDVFVVGESAGAHLAALALLKLRDEGAPRLPPAVFIQGVFDLSATPSVRAATADSLLFDGPNLQRDLARVTPDRDEDGRRRPDVSPLYADLDGMPPALFITGDADPLRDDSLLMAEAWGLGRNAALLDVPFAPHGFQHFVPASAALAQGAIRDWIARNLTPAAVSVDNTNR